MDNIEDKLTGAEAEIEKKEMKGHIQTRETDKTCYKLAETNTGRHERQKLTEKEEGAQ